MYSGLFTVAVDVAAPGGLDKEKGVYFMLNQPCNEAEAVAVVEEDGGTGGWGSYVTIRQTGVYLPAGRHLLRACFKYPDVNFDAFMIIADMQISPPTGAPTEAPTMSPTSVPTNPPTLAPTEAPTSAPTEVPTASPTSAPTEAPTDPPTSAPTDSPTLPPTGNSGPITLRVEMEDYDRYEDQDAGNMGGAYRLDEGVDIEVASVGGFNIGWIAPGEWMEFDLTLEETGPVDLALSLASPIDNNALTMAIDGGAETPYIFGSTGGYQAWETESVATGIILAAGQHTLRFTAGVGSFNMDFFILSTTPVCGDLLCSGSETCSSCPQDCGECPYCGDGICTENGDFAETCFVCSEDCGSCPTGAFAPNYLPGKVEAEDYDLGGPMVAYTDTSAANIGGAYRPDEGVDIEVQGSTVNIGWVDPGEWLVYSTMVTVPGMYSITLRAGSAYPTSDVTAVSYPVPDGALDCAAPGVEPCDGEGVDRTVWFQETLTFPVQGWNVFDDFPGSGSQLITAGKLCLAVCFSGAPLNLDYIMVD
ncbi:unnamed protein product [Chrysoparadoxa australica]